jgi:hypothetical protein
MRLVLENKIIEKVQSSRREAASSKKRMTVDPGGGALP